MRASVGHVKERLELSQDELASYCRRWRIVEMSLFGSVLRDDFGPESDVDVLVRFQPGAMRRYADVVAMEDELAELLGRRVDLIDYRAIVDWSENYIRRKAILESAQLVYTVDEAAVR